MPTYERHARFDRDFQKLTHDQRKQFKTVLVEQFIPCLKTREFPPALRIKRVQCTRGVWEMTWAPDGRATFEYGEEKVPGEPHIIWRRVGTHSIFTRP
ncbi:hypothetical protein [Kibdelosporangium aridum]|uniref:hypothetical protein n=1 Tax=Kibdelosporangium aridum TaxID=2030 RepID=UPI0035E8E4BF